MANQTIAGHKLLLDEYPLIVLPGLASVIGLNESIILQQIHYWIRHNEAARRNLREGYIWTYNRYADWQAQFPFWGRSTIIRAVKELERRNILIAGKFNKLSIDNTKWYRIDYDVLKTVIEGATLNGAEASFFVPSEATDQESVESGMSRPSVQNEQTTYSKRTDHLVKMGRPLPEITPETSSETSEKKQRAPRLSNNPDISEMQIILGFPENGKPDPVPNPAKEAGFIAKMIARGFTRQQVIECWTEKVKTRGQFVSMAWVNEDIGKEPVKSTARRLPSEDELDRQAREKGIA